MCDFISRIDVQWTTDFSRYFNEVVKKTLLDQKSSSMYFIPLSKERLYRITQNEEKNPLV